MYDIFISYSSGDRKWAEVLEERLSASGLIPYRDKTRLVATQPYQQQLFKALDNSGALILVWSKRVRDMKGNWKEWIITEREHFRIQHPDGIIIYILLDNTQPEVDTQSHKLDQLRGEEIPGNIHEAKWIEVIKKIREVTVSDRIEIDCFIAACIREELESIQHDPNFDQTLQHLGLEFAEIIDWYGDSREEWRPAGGNPLRKLLLKLEKILTKVLAEAGVPASYRNKKIIMKTSMEGLWAKDDAEAKKEVERLNRIDFAWFFIDPLSLYHPFVYRMAQRVGGCLKKNPWLNIFLLDPIGHMHNRSCLRDKLQMECSELYHPLIRPGFDATPTCLGALDVWHLDDFERVFRQTVRRRRENGLISGKTRSSRSAYTNLGGGK
jgi:hypothetical protein